MAEEGHPLPVEELGDLRLGKGARRVAPWLAAVWALWYWAKVLRVSPVSWLMWGDLGFDGV